MAKQIPERKCMGCNEKRPKNELLRIVRKPDGTIVPDDTGKISGRGVYICRDSACFKKVRKSGRLAKCLETPIPEDVYDALEAKIAAREPKT